MLWIFSLANLVGEISAAQGQSTAASSSLPNSTNSTPSMVLIGSWTGQCSATRHLRRFDVEPSCYEDSSG